jgi:hypothetical protein
MYKLGSNSVDGRGSSEMAVKCKTLFVSLYEKQEGRGKIIFTE